ncbi:hypothetical protein AK812_SmicGene46766, partial [Symbiodinium microadriaticum]
HRPSESAQTRPLVRMRRQNRRLRERRRRRPHQRASGGSDLPASGVTI